MEKIDSKLPEENLELKTPMVSSLQHYTDLHPFSIDLRSIAFGSQ